jgi:hypothetical protein
MISIDPTGKPYLFCGKCFRRVNLLDADAVWQVGKPKLTLACPNCLTKNPAIQRVAFTSILSSLLDGEAAPVPVDDPRQGRLPLVATGKPQPVPHTITPGKNSLSDPTRLDPIDAAPRPKKKPTGDLVSPTDYEDTTTMRFGKHHGELLQDVPAKHPEITHLRLDT